MVTGSTGGFIVLTPIHTNDPGASGESTLHEILVKQLYARQNQSFIPSTFSVYTCKYIQSSRMKFFKKAIS